MNRRSKIMNPERQKLKYSIIFPTFLVIIMWLVKFIEYSLDISFAEYGIFPLKIKNLTGIIFSPFIHGDFKHLISNTFPIFFFGVTLFYFYRKYAYKIFFLIFFITGFLVWLTARESYHIGASGILYGLAFFLIFSGLITKNRALTAVSFILIFLYGSLIWGVFPSDEKISWESHLLGAISGFLISISFAKYFSESEVIENVSSENSNISITDNQYSDIEYFYKEEVEEIY